MANEAQIRTSLRVKVGNLWYQSNPQAFNADVAGAKGPTPGAIAVALTPTLIDFTQLDTLGGLCRLMNLDEDNYVEWGLFNSDTSEFYPLGEILPGETYIIRLSRLLGTEQPAAGTGTGTSGSAISMRLKATVAPCNVLVEAFDA